MHACMHCACCQQVRNIRSYIDLYISIKHLVTMPTTELEHNLPSYAMQRISSMKIFYFSYFGVHKIKMNLKIFIYYENYVIYVIEFFTKTYL